MTKVIVGTTMSLDGFISDKDGDIGRLYPDFEAMHKAEFLKRAIEYTGAVIMGRKAFDIAQGDFTDYEFQVPIFVLTHNPPTEPTKGQNENLRIIFVTEGGIESAVAQAKEAAGGKDVTVIGGASTAQQCIKADLADELQIGFIPILLGEGLRYFTTESADQLKLEPKETLESPGRVDVFYNIVK